jgi:hypothetical protein
MTEGVDHRDSQRRRLAALAGRRGPVMTDGERELSRFLGSLSVDSRTDSPHLRADVSPA